MRWGLFEARFLLASQKTELKTKHYFHYFDLGRVSALSHTELKVCTGSLSNMLSS